MKVELYALNKTKQKTAMKHVWPEYSTSLFIHDSKSAYRFAVVWACKTVVVKQNPFNPSLFFCLGSFM